jgi:hypothetical protein
VCVCVCVYVCMYVCMYVCSSHWIGGWGGRRHSRSGHGIKIYDFADTKFPSCNKLLPISWSCPRTFQLRAFSFTDNVPSYLRVFSAMKQSLNSNLMETLISSRNHLWAVPLSVSLHQSSNYWIHVSCPNRWIKLTCGLSYSESCGIVQPTYTDVWFG